MDKPTHTRTVVPTPTTQIICTTIAMMATVAAIYRPRSISRQWENHPRRPQERLDSCGCNSHSWATTGNIPVDDPLHTRATGHDLTKIQVTKKPLQITQLTQPPINPLNTTPTKTSTHHTHPLRPQPQTLQPSRITTTRRTIRPRTPPRISIKINTTHRTNTHTLNPIPFVSFPHCPTPTLTPKTPKTSSNNTQI